MARSSTGWCDRCNRAAVAVLPIRSNHPRRDLWPRLPSLSKEGISSAEFRDRNWLGLRHLVNIHLAVRLHSTSWLTFIFEEGLWILPHTKWVAH